MLNVIEQNRRMSTNQAFTFCSRRYSRDQFKAALWSFLWGRKPTLPLSLVPRVTTGVRFRACRSSGVCVRVRWRVCVSCVPQGTRRS